MFQFTVPGMTCGGCARRVTNAILSVDPEAQVITDPPARDVKVTTRADEQALVAALAEAGYPAQRKDQPAAA
ncbi:MAG TPA: heavy-metal-associated domain-containing protein [Amaricoccus sp.]|jgi:copper chaperone|uniref:heavy-metal-associated domain-containing protein n=1 Tax=Amaricoccus sp. TaxID=1872485 RepID=UPI002C5FF894|nr:heavy-metal-associated domain-containing protein [Amaricoccus sp.]HMQ94422.1 heavy-metal-associated domain-containing protein [Amaricoccus sp.]HMR36549.1 heavy-metal-associated domain-containing protein [Paracoccus sp. (in: a-proteobacteria)]HMR53460.1 heavy-metal-associated domain-containing protein [Amaricoccus sp.]HMU00413.1 heavy-metal-associated domain-containing protein [Amaricoccus sp.]